ncbi:MAG: DNA polymerase III subunit gamma/tau [Candidatus Omnitrophica bacterium]|nr:DNA polymerase III subunit gamma/tau [Candidatus Omnitrophota bacterium]
MENEIYQVLARKYRPRTFAEIAGQGIVVKKLQNAISSKRIPHAFLFSGPRGVGKTTIARIFARALNCSEGPAIEPCNKCVYCNEIYEGSSMDFLEIDGASNRGIEEVRALREAVALKPAKARYRIYLIDEVHMLTNEAFNALLKTLEEPPEHAKFIFATTAPEKIPATIVSRCQRYDFKPLKFDEISGMIKKVVENEGYSIEPEAMKKLIETGYGSLRDILGYLDQVIVLAEEKTITLALVTEVLGIASGESAWEIIKIFVDGDIKQAINYLHKLVSEGKDITNLLSTIAKKMQMIIWDYYGISSYDEDSDRGWIGVFKNVAVEKFIKAIELVMQTKEKIRYEPLELVLAELLCFNLVETLRTPLEKQNVPIVDRAQKEMQEEKVEKQKKKPAESENEQPVSQDEPLERIKGKWEEILGTIKKNKPLLYAALREGKPVKIEGNCIHIAFGDNFRFLCQKVIENKSFVEKTLEKILGNNYTIDCFISDSEKKISLKDSAEVKQIIEFFGGGEIVEKGE